MSVSAFGATPSITLVCDDRADQIDVDVWVDRELAPLLPPAAMLICVDGMDGAGKSTIARSLARRLGAQIVEVDRYLERNQGRYLAALDLVSLKRDLRLTEKVVAEGCLIHAILNQVGLQPDFSIYVVRTSQMRGHPETESIDEHELLFGSKTAEQYIVDEEDQLRRWAEIAPEFVDAKAAELPGLTKELIRYHRDFSPHKRADLILRAVRIS